MALKNDLYSYNLKWSEEDQQHVASCLEFPSFKWLDKDPKKALQKIQDEIEKVITDMKNNNEIIPEPLAKPEKITPPPDLED